MFRSYIELNNKKVVSIDKYYAALWDFDSGQLESVISRDLLEIIDARFCKWSNNIIIAYKNLINTQNNLFLYEII